MMMLADIAQAQEAFYGCGALFFWMGAVVIGAAAVLGILAMTLVVTPNMTQRCADALRHRNFVSFLAGLPFLGIFVVFAAIAKAAPVVGGLGLLGLSVFFLVGLASASEDIGRRLYWACGKEGTRFAHLASGWSVFFLAACVPVIGWFIILPYVALTGLGSILVSAFRGEPPAQARRDIVWEERG